MLWKHGVSCDGLQWADFRHWTVYALFIHNFLKLCGTYWTYRWSVKTWLPKWFVFFYSLVEAYFYHINLSQLEFIITWHQFKLITTASPFKIADQLFYSYISVWGLSALFIICMAQGEHANSKLRVSSQTAGSNPEPSYSDLTILTTAPPCHQQYRIL